MMSKWKRRYLPVGLVVALVGGPSFALLSTGGCGIIGPVPSVEDVDQGKLEVKDPTTGADRAGTVDDLIALLEARLEKVDRAIVRIEGAADAAGNAAAKIGDVAPGPAGDAADLVGWGVGLVSAAGTGLLARQKAKIQAQLARALARKAELEAQLAATPSAGGTA